MITVAGAGGILLAILILVLLPVLIRIAAVIGFILLLGALWALCFFGLLEALQGSDAPWVIAGLTVLIGLPYAACQSYAHVIAISIAPATAIAVPHDSSVH